VFAHHPNVLSLIGSGVIIAAATLLTLSKDVDHADDESHNKTEESEMMYQALPTTSVSEINSARQTFNQVDTPCMAQGETTDK
jgi:hypothetical protein